MAASVNFDNLRSITDGDAEIEAVLFASFLSAARTCFDKMSVALTSGDEVQWRQQAHAFKGVCMNLGANPLSELCAKAQMDWRAPEDDKRAMLQSIENEMVNVRRILDQQAKA